MAHVSELGDEGPAAYFDDTLDAQALGADMPAGRYYRRYLKRTFDVLVILLAAPFVLPLVLVLALLVRRDGGPAFYCQDRVGLSGRNFRLWKLRSMVPDADRLLEAHLDSDPEARAEWDRTQKLKADPRITPVGRFIRKASLDELPQLWNVLVGEMSLVGPRPMMPSQAPLYPGRAYYALRPGLTGFWQISSRNQTSFAARAAFDTRYAQRLSLATDLAVLLATVRVVLRGTGY
jgi:exopolysaccharide production protein ExoY